MTVTIKAGTTLADGTTKLAADVTLELPRLKFGVMGRPGSGKSRLIASMPKPLLVQCSDPEEKLAPYFDRCGDVERRVGQFGQTVLIGMSPRTKAPIMQIELYNDEDPKSPTAFTNILARADQLREEVMQGMWASVAYDSWSQMQTLALWRRQFGPMAVKDADAFGRAHGAAYADLKTLVQARIMPLRCNVALVFHTTETIKEEGGVSFFGIKAGGKDLPTELASLLPERYRATAEADGVTRRLWTRPDGRFDLCTLIDAPSPCANEYTALWSNWIQKRAAAMVAAQQAAAGAAPEGESK